jgi:hypothetical protein
MFVCIPFLGLISVILGSLAFGKIRRSEGQLGGRKIALIAIGLGLMSSLGWVLAANLIQPWVLDQHRLQMTTILEETFQGIQDRRDINGLDVFTSDARPFTLSDVQILGEQLESNCGPLKGVFVWRLGEPQGSWNVQRWPAGFTLEFMNAEVEGDAIFVISSGQTLLSEVRLEELEIRVPRLNTITFPPRYDEEVEKVDQGDSTNE